MRSPVLIAETPFAGGHGPRFLAPNGREVDADVASYYIGRVREVENDVEEVEGEDYLAVQRLLTDDASGHSGAEILVLAGIDVDRMSSNERDEVLEQLRERLEVLNDAVAAIDWSIQGNAPVIEIPELDEWHEASWDALPRIGPWADPEAEEVAAAQEEPTHESELLTPSPAASEESWRGEDLGSQDQVAVFSGVDAESRSEEEQHPEPHSEVEAVAEEQMTETEEETPLPEPAHAKASDTGEQRPSVTVTVHAVAHDEPPTHGPSFHEESGEGSKTAQHEEMVVSAVAPPPPEAEKEATKPAPVILEIPLNAPKHEQPAAHGPVTLIVQVLADPKAMKAEEPEPQPDVIVPAREPAPILPSAPIDPPIKLASIDPIQVSAAADRSPALAPIQPAATEPEPEARRGLRWWVWFPWTATAMLLVGSYLYLTKVDRTWHQRVTETHYASGKTRTVVKQVEVEKIVEKPVDREVEKIVVKEVIKEVPVSDPDMLKKEQWARFALAYRGLMASQDIVTAAELLNRWEPLLPAWGKEAPPGLKELKGDYLYGVGLSLAAWATGRAGDRRFAEAYLGLGSFAASSPVQSLITEARAKELATTVRRVVRDSEDEYHYTQIKTLLESTVVPEDRLTQHINAYLAIIDPPGRRLAEVQKLAVYRQWQKDGQPVKAVVKIEWGPRVPGREHQVEIALGSGKDTQVLNRTIAAEPGRVWVETFPLKGIVTNYRVKTTRPTSPVEELIDAGKQRIELFLSDPAGPLTVANEVESGTKVTVDWQGVVERPTLPAWNNLPAVPTSLPKVGP